MTPPLIPRGLGQATGPVDVELTAEDEAWGNRVGDSRNGNARKVGAAPTLGMRGIEEQDRLGARCELVIARAYDAPWRDPERHDRTGWHRPDVGGVDVRGTGNPRGAMPVRPRRDESPGRPIAFVLNLGRRCYRIVGWFYTRDAKRDDWWRPEEPPAYWAVPQRALFDPAWLDIERNP